MSRGGMRNIERLTVSTVMMHLQSGSTCAGKLFGETQGHTRIRGASHALGRDPMPA